MSPRKHRWPISSVAVLMFAGVQPAFATGYWNVPSSWWQNMGFGCGGGYHAPLVLGPPNCREAFRHNHYRLPFAPSPPPYAGECAYCSEAFSAPSVMAPAPAPTPGIAPTSRTPGSLFLP